MDAWEKYEKVLEALGAERMADSMMQWLDSRTLDKMVSDIATDWEIELDEDEDE